MCIQLLHYCHLVAAVVYCRWNLRLFHLIAKSGLSLRACSSPIDNDCSWGSWEASSLYLVIYEDTLWTKRCSVTLHWSERICVRRVCLSVRASPASKKLCQLHASIPTLMAVCNAHTARTCFLLLIHFKVAVIVLEAEYILERSPVYLRANT